jgi:hypothetical protein
MVLFKNVIELKKSLTKTHNFSLLKYLTSNMESGKDKNHTFSFRMEINLAEDPPSPNVIETTDIQSLYAKKANLPQGPDVVDSEKEKTDGGTEKKEDNANVDNFTTGQWIHSFMLVYKFRPIRVLGDPGTRVVYPQNPNLILHGVQKAQGQM